MSTVKQNLKYLAFFLLGFTVWIPFLMISYDMCPYKLFISANTIGWQKTDLIPKIEGVPETVSMSIYGLAFFYILYFCLIVFIYLCSVHLTSMKKNELKGEKDV
jgi:hypothetical protein